MTGGLNFMEAPWGPIEPWDDCAPKLLQERGVYTHLITDHYHYFHSGGEHYHTLFSSWEFLRGQEGDVWHPLVRKPKLPEKVRGKGVQRRAYWANREFKDPERDEDYPTPQCFMQAMEFLRNNGNEDNWHLHLEVFDPHEPFECPKKYRDMFNDTWDKYFYNWPAYGPLDPKEDDASAVEHIRKCYAGALAMADVWLGRMLDVMDEMNLWENTTVILTTDHGHMLGEHNYWAKNYMMDYQELVHIPMIVCSPEAVPGRRSALTATMDLMPTLMELHGAPLPPHVHGKSFRHLFTGDGDHHDAVLFGYFGKDIGMTDGKYSYCRQPLPESRLYHYTAAPRNFADFMPRETLKAADFGVFLKTADGIPHYRIESKSSRHANAPDFNPVFDVTRDPGQEHPIHDAKLEERLAAKMKELMVRYEAPECQFTRMGLDGERKGSV